MFVSSRRLQLNTDKTQLIWFGSRQILEKVSGSDFTLQLETLQLDSGILKPVEEVRDFGVWLDRGIFQDLEHGGVNQPLGVPSLLLSPSLSPSFPFRSLHPFP